ncbi:DMT family transporter [Rufibacter glacialis]|uniref:DMT family transporter n=2 Tax=Rufibacter glacialis TaxID=1259555 RepID=A0ABV4RF18_9BACT|nr:DMT family transporter [Rufibacter glacialis]GGK75041.1 membrane protein [Rufibacter glacialis]
MTKGVQYMLLSTFFFAFMNVCVKFLSHLPPMEVVLFRSIISLVLTYTMIRRVKVSPWGNRKPILLLRGLAGAFSLLMLYTTLQNIPLAGAVTIQYLAPIFTALLGVFIAKEKVAPWQWVFFLISFAGVLVIEGVDTRISLYYLLIGIGSAFLSGVAYTSVRKLSETEHPLVIVFYFPLVSLPLSVVFCLFDWVPVQGDDWLWLGLTGILTQLGQYFMTRAYQAEKLARVANLNYIGILYAVVLGMVFFDETFSLYAYLGIVLVLLGVALNMQYSRKLRQREAAQATA